MPNIMLNDMELSMNSYAILTIVAPLAILLVYLLFTDFSLALRSTGYNKRFSEVMGISNEVFWANFEQCTDWIRRAMLTQYQGFCEVSGERKTHTSVIIGEKVLRFKKLDFSYYRVTPTQFCTYFS